MIKSCKTCNHLLVCWVVKTMTEIIETTPDLFEGTNAVLDVWESLGKNCKQYRENEQWAKKSNSKKS